MNVAAQRIDFSFSNAQEPQTHEPDYIEWKIPHAASSSMTFDNGVEITVSAAGKADVLRDQWNKNACNKGRDTEQVGLRLLGDGVAAFIADGDNTPTLTDTKRKELITLQFELKTDVADNRTNTAYVSGNIREEKNHTLTQDKLNDTYNANGYVPTDYEYFISQPLFPSYAKIHSAKDALKLVIR